MLYPLIAGLSAAAAASLLGNLVVLQRLSLAADVLSHVALPGLALGLALGWNPFAGGLGFLLLAVISIWGLERRTKLPLDALIGVLFTVSLAVGALLFDEKEELLEALFGNLAAIGWLDALITLGGALVVILFLFIFFRSLVLSLVSPDLASARGLGAEWMRLLFLLLLALAVAIGIKAVGVLLVGSLLILPPATAQFISRGIYGALLVSTLIGMGATAAGIFLAMRWGVEGGPFIVLILAALFVLALLIRSR